MLKKGNGAPRRCVMNLLATRRGEVWFDRLCGLPDRIDDPGYSAAANMRQDARHLIETYEPRVRVDGVGVVPDGKNGDFKITASVTEITNA